MHFVTRPWSFGLWQAKFVIIIIIIILGCVSRPLCSPSLKFFLAIRYPLSVHLRYITYVNLISEVFKYQFVWSLFSFLRQRVWYSVRECELLFEVATRRRRWSRRWVRQTSTMRRRSARWGPSRLRSFLCSVLHSVIVIVISVVIIASVLWRIIQGGPQKVRRSNGRHTSLLGNEFHYVLVQYFAVTHSFSYYWMCLHWRFRNVITGKIV